MKKIYVALAFAIGILAACKKDSNTPIYNTQNLAHLSIEFDNIVGNKTLGFNSTIYNNLVGESYTISHLKYFISNIKVTALNNQTYVVPQDSAYFLIDASNKSKRFAKVNVPEGDYKKLEFILGVDSIKSTASIDKRTGVLDPALTDMYWGWNAGYIFFKLEGNAPVITDDQLGDPTGKKQFKYHIGGFGGYNMPTINNIKTIQIDLENGGIAKVRKDRKSNIHLFVDVSKVFNGTNSFSIKANPNVKFSQFSTLIAANLTEMFTHDHTEN